MTSNPDSPAAELARRNSERAQLRDIKERFSNYVRNVRVLRNQLTQGEGFTAAPRLEQEVLGIRANYEQEIQSLRAALEKYRELAQGGNHRETPTAPEYHSRLLELSRDLIKKDQEIRHLQLLMAQKEAEMQGLKTAAVTPSIQLDLAKQELKDLHQSLCGAQERYEEEHSKRLQLHDQVLDLTGRMDQMSDKHRQESEEMRDRIDQSEALVLQLEQKLRAATGGGSALMEAVQKIQEASEAEVKRLQQETESAYSLSLLQLQMQMNSDQRLLSRTQEENQNLQRRLEELSGELALTERKELQDVLLAKMKELAAFQESNVSLRNELDALRSLLEEEEQQMSSDQFLSSSSSSGPALTHSFLSSDLTIGLDCTASPLIGSLDVLSPPTTAKCPKSPSPAESEEPNQNLDEGPKPGGHPRPASAPPLSPNVPPGTDPAAPERRGLTVNRKKPSPNNDCTPAISSALRDLAISEVDPGGKFVKIINKSLDKEEDIGGHILQQNIGGHPVALYRFPPKTRMLAHSEVTVWAASANVPHKPPSDFLWKDLDEFVTGPQCTTILCKANGQAVAWYTPARGTCSPPVGRKGDTTATPNNSSLLWTLPQPNGNRESEPESPKQVPERTNDQQKWEEGPILLRRYQYPLCSSAGSVFPWVTHGLSLLPLHGGVYFPVP
uniref:LTD domain-containing protein n=1 Tax=Xenopus tropicalis TaxID=8364 RepID=A0A803KCC4_XENTR